MVSSSDDDDYHRPDVDFSLLVDDIAVPTYAAVPTATNSGIDDYSDDSFEMLDFFIDAFAVDFV